MRSITALLFLCAPAAALALAPGDLSFHPTPVLTRAAVPWTSGGVGSPAIAWDSTQNRYLMVFETQITTNAICPQGVWGLGGAVSDDGYTWTVSGSPILEPTPGDGTYFDCVAAHPTIIYDEGRRAAFVWFKAEQNNTLTCTGGAGDPSWGCEQYTGVGRARIQFNAFGGIQNVATTAEPDLPLSGNFGFPKVVQVGTTSYMMLSQKPDVYMATGGPLGPSDPNWALVAGPVLEHNTALWTEDELWNPALACTNSAFPFTSFVGGRQIGHGGTILTAGFGEALSPNGIQWLLGITPIVSWAGDSDWRHWDVTRTNAGDWILYYSSKDVSGFNEVYVAATDLAWDPTDTYTKICP